MRGTGIGSVIAMGVASACFAAPLTLQVDQTQSAVDVELCLSAGTTACDSGNSPVAGSIALDMACPLAPTTVSVHDFEFIITDDVNLYIEIPFTGTLDATAQNVVISYAIPGTPLPPTPLVTDTFSYTGVPVAATGQLSYVATGAVCLGLTVAGLPCGSPGSPAVLDLSTFTLDPLDLSATLTFPDEKVVLASNLAFTGPLVDTNPELGTLSAIGAVVADAPLPTSCCDVDLTGGDTVNLTDHFLLSGCLTGPDGVVTGGCACADIDADGDTDLADFAELQIALAAL